MGWLVIKPKTGQETIKIGEILIKLDLARLNSSDRIAISADPSIKIEIIPPKNK